MTDELFNVVASVGIALTFIASIIAIIVSLASLKASNKAAKRSDYLGTITASRERWSISLRENASFYFTQIGRICGGQEENLAEIYNELTRCHFAIVLLLFEQDSALHDNMSAVRNKAFQIVDQNKIIENQFNKYKDSPNMTIELVEEMDIVISARKKMYELRCSILEEYQGEIFKQIQALNESEWRKQQYEATEMWNEK